MRRARGSPAGVAVRSGRGSGEEGRLGYGGPPQTPSQVGEKIMGISGRRGESRREKAVREAAGEETGEMTQRHRTTVGAQTQKLNSKERGGLEQKRNTGAAGSARVGNKSTRWGGLCLGIPGTHGGNVRLHRQSKPGSPETKRMGGSRDGKADRREAGRASLRRPD